MATALSNARPSVTYEIKEQECKFICLHREITVKIQKLLSYFSVDPNLSSSSTVDAGTCLSKILQNYVNTPKGPQNFHKCLYQLMWPENEEKIFVKPYPNHPKNNSKTNSNNNPKNKIVFKSFINVNELDISSMMPILVKIPFFPTCSLGFAVSNTDINKIKHSNTSCKNNIICCGKCLQCIKCSHKCDLSNLQLDHARKVRNKVHLTPQEFEEINEIVKNDPTNQKAIDWITDIRELAATIKTICNKISPAGTCYKDCDKCKRIDSVINQEMRYYMNDFFDNVDSIRSYYEKIFAEPIKDVSDKTDIILDKVDRIEMKTDQNTVTMCGIADTVVQTSKMVEELMEEKKKRLNRAPVSEINIINKRKI